LDLEGALQTDWRLLEDSVGTDPHACQCDRAPTNLPIFAYFWGDRFTSFSLLAVAEGGQCSYVS